MEGDNSENYECYTVKPDNQKPLIAVQNYVKSIGSCRVTATNGLPAGYLDEGLLDIESLEEC